MIKIRQRLPQVPSIEATQAEAVREADLGLEAISGDLGLAAARASEPAKRVLGQTRSAARVPSHLKPYSETVVIGGDVRVEEPEPAGVEQVGSGDFTGADPVAPSLPPAPQIDKEIIAKAEAEAQQIRERAQQEAQQFTAQVQAQIQEQAEAIRQAAQQQGHQEGFEAGMAEGREQGMLETSERNEQLKGEFVELVLARRKVLAAIEPEVVKLTVDVAEKIIGMELATGRDVITGIVRQALATLKERDEIVIRVNPAEVDTVKASQAAFEAMIEGLKRFEVVADGAMDAGSCAIETNLGNVDARVATQLEAVRAGLDEMAKIRSFEVKDKLEVEPVEVPGDPEFHARQLQAQAEARAEEAAKKAEH